MKKFFYGTLSRLSTVGRMTPTAPPFDSSSQQHQRLRFGTWSIRSGRGEGLITALRAMSQMNGDFGFLTETKVTDNIYPRRFADYTIVATNAVSPHQGRVALFFQENSSYQVESTRRWGPLLRCYHREATNWVPGGIHPPCGHYYITTPTEGLGLHP